MKYSHWSLVHSLVVIIAAATITISLLAMTQMGEDIRDRVFVAKTMSRAPVTFFLNSSESKEIISEKYTVQVNYLESSPQQKIQVIINGQVFDINKGRTTCEGICGELITYKTISVVVEPVTWIKNTEGQDVWKFETWDTDQIYVKILIG